MAIYHMRSSACNAEAISPLEHRRDELISYGYTEITPPEKKPKKPRDEPAGKQ